MTACNCIMETECECREKFTSYFADWILDAAQYYVLHSDTDRELTRSEKRRVLSKQKKLKTSYKKQRRNKEKLLTKFYTATII